MSENFVIVDANMIVELFFARGQAGWNGLLHVGEPIVVLRDLQKRSGDICGRPLCDKAEVWFWRLLRAVICPAFRARCS